MGVWEALSTAVRSLAANRARSILTALGIIIGVGAIIALMALGEGLTATVEQQFTDMGANLITVMPQGGQGAGLVRGGAQVYLANEDWQLLAANLNSSLVAGIAPEASRSFQVKYLNNNLSARVVGTTPDYPGVRNYHPAAGTFFTRVHLEQRQPVAVLGAGVAEDLFGASSPVGQRIRIGGTSFTVAGVMEAKGQEGFGSVDDQILVPLTTFQSRLGGGGLSTIYVAAAAPEYMDDLQQRVTALLRRAHRIENPENDDFAVRNMASVLDSLNQMMSMITLFLTGIAAISLVVGGIGIMNVMLMSVTERVREIGIRMAVGARRRDILGQFLAESLVLSVGGGVVGIVAGYLLAFLLGRVLGVTTTVTLTPVLLGFGFSVLVGVFFGFYPARRAAAMQPVEALRYE